MSRRCGSRSLENTLEAEKGFSLVVFSIKVIPGQRGNIMRRTDSEIHIRGPLRPAATCAKVKAAGPSLAGLAEPSSVVETGSSLTSTEEEVNDVDGLLTISLRRRFLPVLSSC